MSFDLIYSWLHFFWLYTCTAYSEHPLVYHHSFCTPISVRYILYILCTRIFSISYECTSVRQHNSYLCTPPFLLYTSQDIQCKCTTYFVQLQVYDMVSIPTSVQYSLYKHEYMTLFVHTRVYNTIYTCMSVQHNLYTHKYALCVVHLYLYSQINEIMNKSQ